MTNTVRSLGIGPGTGCFCSKYVWMCWALEYWFIYVPVWLLLCRALYFAALELSWLSQKPVSECIKLYSTNHLAQWPLRRGPGLVCMARRSHKDISVGEETRGLRGLHRWGDVIFALETNLSVSFKPLPLPMLPANSSLSPNCPTPLSFYYHLSILWKFHTNPGVLKWFPLSCSLLQWHNGRASGGELPERVSYCWASDLNQAKKTIQGLCSTGSKTHLEHCLCDFILELAQ